MDMPWKEGFESMWTSVPWLLMMLKLVRNHTVYCANQEGECRENCSNHATQCTCETQAGPASSSSYIGHTSQGSDLYTSQDGDSYISQSDNSCTSWDGNSYSGKGSSSRKGKHIDVHIGDCIIQTQNAFWLAEWYILNFWHACNINMIGRCPTQKCSLAEPVYGFNSGQFYSVSM